MEKIHDCQTNANEEIYMKAYNMIEKYFSDEDDVENNPNVAQTEQGSFGFGTNGPQGGSGFNFASANGDSMDM
jgi:importin subunit alpha-1